MNVFSFFHKLVLITALAFVLWFGGLLSFVSTISEYKEPKINETTVPTDAIVVLTGGSERIHVGIELIKAEKGKKLFVSGVHPRLGLDKLLVGQDVDDELRECCIILGHAADNTVGNAMETAVWIQNEDFHSIRLVTAHYHMLRSLLLFREALPYTKIIPHPVVPGSVKLDYWWLRPGTASLLVTEYNKYVVALLHTRARLFFGQIVGED